MRKILRKFYANIDKILGFRKILTKRKKSWRNFEECKNSLRNIKFVKYLRKFQKNLKTLHGTFRKILKKCKFWKNELIKKIDNSKEILKIMKIFILTRKFWGNLWLILTRLLGISFKILKEFYENRRRILEK